MSKTILRAILPSLIFIMISFNYASAELFTCQCANGQKGIAQTCGGCTITCSQLGSSWTGLGCVPSGSATITSTTPTNNSSCPSGAVCLDNPLGAVTSPQALIGRIINSVLGVVGSIALLMFVYGGLIWMTSSGNPEKVKSGRDIIVWSAIGLAVIFLAYALTRVVITAITAQ